MVEKETKELVRIMSEAELQTEFIPELATVTEVLFDIIVELRDEHSLPDREMCFLLSKEVDKTETFLDDYGATNNKKFFYFRELIASMRWIDVAIFHAVHLFARFDNYAMALEYKEWTQFLSQAKEALVFYTQGLKNLGEELIREAETLGIHHQKKKDGREKTFGLIQKKILPPDIDENVVRNEQEWVLEIMRKFLEACEQFTVFACGKEPAERVSEESLESYRSLFNRIQALYDSYLKNTNAEHRLPDLKIIRGHASVPLHLLEIGRALMHFYERHSDRIRQYPSAVKIGRLVKKEEIKTNVSAFVLAEALKFVTRGKEISRSIFEALGVDPEDYILDTKVLMIPAYRIEDFHIRPIMPLTQIAAKFGAESYLYFNRKKYNLKSAIEMAIAIPDIRERLVDENAAIMIQGPRRAMKLMQEFMSERCGAYEKEICGEQLETQSARLDKSGNTDEKNNI